ncbi:MAG: AraC family transcriptional regulator [Kiritimatiellales bacterium]
MHQNKPLRAEFEKIVADERQSFLWRQVIRKQFGAPYHYHPEYELIYIRRGYGRRLVGGSIAHFGPGDLVFIAPNVPHMWRVAPKCPEAETFYIQFLPGFIGAEFFKQPEMQPVRELMEAARAGVTFSASVRKETAARFKKFPTLNTSERLLELLDILYRLSQDRDSHPVGRSAGRTRLNRRQEERISKAFQYLNQNLTGPISQAEVAQSVRLSSAAFSRLFKSTTGKCFMEVVKELRIAQACRLLTETTRTISEIAYECGYETLSHFNCQFRSVMKTTPSRYRQNIEILRGRRA